MRNRSISYKAGLAAGVLLLAIGSPLPISAQISGRENPFSNAGDKGAEATGRADAPLPRPSAKPEFLIRMSKEDCRRLIRQSAVPGPDYQPGVDVRGNPVAPANIPGQFTDSDLLPDAIAFELSLNPLEFAGNPALADLFSGAEAGFGEIRYALTSGALTLDGRRLNAETTAEILTFCRAALQP